MYWILNGMIHDGKHNGTVNGKHYFYTMHPNAGSFIRPDKLGPFESLESAARERYLGDSEKSLDQQLIREAQESLQASLNLNKIMEQNMRIRKLEQKIMNMPLELGWQTSYQHE
uniref:CAP-Gly domain-containing protein n=1 Tax=Glossina brevipalpis TaxID=37001 RepID=A0A1A9WHV2_9MUSC